MLYRVDWSGLRALRCSLVTEAADDAGVFSEGGVSSIKINTLWEELKDGLTLQVKENY